MTPNETTASVGEVEVTFDRFQQANERRCPEAFDHALNQWSLLEWAGAMCGEAGEVANVAKKILRKQQEIGGSWAERDPDLEKLQLDLSGEIGDTLAYLSLLASAAGLNLGECAARKFDFISDKVGWPGERLCTAAAAKQAEGPNRPMNLEEIISTLIAVNECHACFCHNGSTDGPCDVCAIDACIEALAALNGGDDE